MIPFVGMPFKDQCVAGFPAEGNQFAWWIMENEQE